MTLEVLENKISELIAKRAEAHGDNARQDEINKKLTKLYDVKFIMQQQKNIF